MLVDKWGLSREALDEYALQTHCRAAAARAGWSQREMIRLEKSARTRVCAPIRIRPGWRRCRGFSGRTARSRPSTRAKISDGAAAVLLASGQKAGSVARTVEISNRAGLAVRVNYSAPQPERLVDEQDQANHIPFGQPPHLAFPDHVHRCVALNCSRARWKDPNPWLAFTRRLIARWSCSTMLFK